MQKILSSTQGKINKQVALIHLFCVCPLLSCVIFIEHISEHSYTMFWIKKNNSIQLFSCVGLFPGYSLAVDLYGSLIDVTIVI